MFVVGLTGNFGMGKTLVLETLRELGVFTIDADEVVHELLEEKPVLDKLRPLLGADVFDAEGKLLRDKVADKIFKDESLRIDVENTLHPLVFERIDGMLKEAKPEIAVVEATLIFERGHEGRFDKTVVVYTDEETAIKRLEAEGVSKEDAVRRLAFQMPVEEKVKVADFAIDNSGSPEETKSRVAEVYLALLQEAAK